MDNPRAALLHHLLSDPTSQLLQAQQTQDLVRLGSGNLILLHDFSEETLEGMRALGRSGPPVPLDVVVCGGPEDLQATLDTIEASPDARAAVHFFHLDPARRLLQREDLSPALAEAIRQVDAQVVTPDQVEARIEQAVVRTEALYRFQQRVGANRPVVTGLLTASILLAFVGEMIWGGSTSNFTLYRMGANVGEQVQAGEVWRLLASAFLHGGPIHLLLNLMVLFNLGSFMERILGSAGFLLLYVLSALAGSVASALHFGDVLSVGASGALWGMLGASAWIAFFPRNLVPEPLAVSLRKNAGTNLLLNLVVSFQPNVDWAAHLGGGVMGVLLIATGVMGARWLTIPAGIAGGLLWGSFGMALVQGKPWAMNNPEWTRHMVAGVMLEMPAYLKPEPCETEPNGLERCYFGSIRWDPLVVVMEVGHIAPPLPDASLDAEFAALKELRLTEALPPELKRITEPTVSGHTLTEPLQMGGLRYTRFTQMAPNAVVTVSVIQQPEVALETRILGSVVVAGGSPAAQ